MSGGEAARMAVGRYRYLLLAVVWATFFVGAMDRANVSVLLVDPRFLDDMGITGDPQRQGLLMTLLLLPYALSNVFLGPLADWWGPRRVLSGMVVAWSVTALAMGSVGSFTALLVGRIGRGVAEGPLFPIANRYVKYWFPAHERGRANGIWLTGQRLGLAAVPLLTLAVAFWGWRASFYAQAFALAVLILPAIWLVAGDTPKQARWVSRAEEAYIAAGTAAAPQDGAHWQQGLRPLLTNYRYWLAISHHLASMAIYNGLATWLPKYLHEERGFDLGQMALFAALPYVCSTASTLAFGMVSDRFASRAIFCTAGLLGGALGIFLAAMAPDPLTSASLIALGFLAWGVSTPSYYAIVQRIIPGPIVATGIGIDNGLSNLGAAMAPLAVGILIAATGSYLSGLLLLAGVGVAGALATAVLAWQKY